MASSPCRMRKSSGELVAVKVLNLDVDNAFDEEIADTQKEIRMLSLICGDSPFCTKYHESIVVDMKLWIVMEYCGVGSVRDVLKSGVLEEKHIAIIVRQVLQALVYLHNRCNIIHRDIKSANILLSNDNGVKLCDFGVAGQITMTSLRRNSFVGSPHWMAPEVIQRASYDFKADIWSLGITIIEMALGNPPHSNQDPRRAIFLIPRTKPPRLDGRYSASMKEFLALCLREEPTERPTAEELLKTKFIRNAPKGTIQLADLIARHEQWKQAHGEGIPETYVLSRLTIVSLASSHVTVPKPGSSTKRMKKMTNGCLNHISQGQRAGTLRQSVLIPLL
ncbi:Pkinase-domain-containing protein [Gonapodya prolifera JEL478]|uniref:Pkinase-domain-containing protein n=1 Tax=Gonapodya prolifera (strain JEL478) TaxID=1344416 RepID=A0A139AGT6_GONPJ|nr:Pkinase-domain-containing protein [Gonapodya prolifera JEL478]|eukprot:KXS16016.1 Pkinase-domain-containing protein [Gonapodya prolifera JEL478]